MLFVTSSLPHSLLESAIFKIALDTYKRAPNVKLMQNKMKDRIQQLGEKTVDGILTKLSLQKSPVTLAIDGWTNVRSNKVTNLLLISNGISYFYASIENEKKMTLNGYLHN